jgi:hypothetical protein
LRVTGILGVRGREFIPVHRCRPALSKNRRVYKNRRGRAKTPAVRTPHNSRPARLTVRKAAVLWWGDRRSTPLSQHEEREMKRFLAQIELHPADPNDRERLRQAMEKEGFVPFFEDKREDVGFELPAGMFLTECQLEAGAVFDKAKHAGRQTGKHFSLIVAEATALRWTGLLTLGKPS